MTASLRTTLAVCALLLPAAGGLALGEPATPRGSPRAAVAGFVADCTAGDHQRAAGALDLAPAQQASAATLAQHLCAVLEARLAIDPGALSDLPGGDPADGLPEGVDEIGRIAVGAGGSEPVRLARRADGDWRFSRATTDLIERWYRQLDRSWLVEHLPAGLLRAGPFGLPVWQWLALPLALVLAWSGGLLLSRLSRALLARLVAGTKTRWDDALLDRLGAPLTVAWTLAFGYLMVAVIGLHGQAELSVHRALRGGLFADFFWALMRSLDLGATALAQSAWTREHPGARSLIPLASRVGKVAILAVAVVALLSELGYPVASLVAGLGIGGLALALAAQKTVENLFGAFSIGTDQPFREGDFVRIQDFVGTVEAIGLRSTKIRTLDRTLVSMPNGKLADMRLESFAARDRIRLACELGLVYGTTTAQMRQILAELERALREHPKIWPDAVVVRFKALADFSLNIEVMAWFQTADWGEFQLIRQELLLRFMEIVERAGSSFAFPTRTVHVVA